MEKENFSWPAFRRALKPKITWASPTPPAGKWPELGTSQIEAFEKHAARVLAANKKFNLTRITKPEEMATKHYLDSLTCALALDFSAIKTVCDIGSGAGFPGIPLAIIFPEIAFTLLESQKKKADFLSETIADLGLDNCRVLAERAETAGRGELRESFDLVIARGLAVLPVAAELGLPLAKIGGYFLAMGGKIEEKEEYKQIFAIIGGGNLIINKFCLSGAGERTLLLIHKSTSTPDKYPRRPGMPSKRPLK
jgi:16S rRNA (guanine527-N7)-methyltransferase